MNEKISLAGDLGSGKSTVSALLVEALGAEYYSTGAIVRSIAAKRGMTVVELNVYMETHPEIDTEIDNGIAALSAMDKPMIIDSRMAWHFTRGTFKVYLSTDTETSALRIMTANRVGEHAATLEETVAETRARRESEKKRYRTQYGVNIKDLSNYSLVVDTTYATPPEIAECILTAFAEWKENPSHRAVLISPDRFFYPDDEPNAALISEYSAALERGDTIPEVTAVEWDNEFYIISGAEAALAHAFNFSSFVPTRLVDTEVDRTSYVKMKNSL